MHTNRGLKKKLVYFLDIVCDANIKHEWNPFYCIMGRREAALKPENHAKWSEVWPMVSESAGASAQLKLKLTYNTVFIFYYDISWGQSS